MSFQVIVCKKQEESSFNAGTCIDLDEVLSMETRSRFRSIIPFYVLVLLSVIALAIGGSRAVSVIAENSIVDPERYIVIDAGHGGEDGGATSVSGILEKYLNLEISLRLRDLLNLLGMHTVMIRTDDRSVYTQGDSIASRKASDLRQRVKIINGTEGALLISIHQNYFPQSQYSGPQVFYAETSGSKELSQILQRELVNSLNPGSNRAEKRATGIYLMENINCTAVLIECVFLSNPQEEKQLCSADYQKKLCCVIVGAISTYLAEGIS